MKSMRMLGSGTAVVAGLALALVTPAGAQGTKPAGVVTTLQGTANVQRVSTAQPTPQVLPLRFRQDVFAQDRITTGDQSLARILLGGKAVVTVREHSSLTITDTGDTATLDVASGKIALAVAKDRMKPGEQINVKTPNAVAGVRGTVLITEVVQATAAAADPPGTVTTRFTLLTGIVDVSLLDPTTGRPGTSRFTLNPLQTVGITGFTPPQPPRNITPAQGAAAANDYKAPLKDAPAGSNAQITDRQVENASNAAAGAAAGGGGNVGTGGTGIVDKNNNKTGGTDPGSHLPPGCSQNCAPPPVVKNNGNGGNNLCLGECPSEGFRARIAGTRRR
jgi:hypothetical protein